MASDEDTSHLGTTSPEQSEDEISNSQESTWEPPEEDDDDGDYDDEGASDENDDDSGTEYATGDGELMIDLEGYDDMTQQLLQDYIGGGLFANINAIINHFEEYSEDEELDNNIQSLLSDGAELLLVYTDAYGEDDEPDSLLTPRRRLAVLVEREYGNRPILMTRDQIQYLLRRNRILEHVTIYFREPVYSGQFSRDGNFYFACGADFKVRLYDTSNPYSWKHYKTVSHPWAQWTLTDASLSPDNRWLAYTSLSPSVCLAPTDPNDKGDPYALDLSSSSGTGGEWRSTSRGYASAYFQTSLLRVKGHDDDVNAVCFADTSSPHILYSGSDDSVIKVWDRRSMGDRREAGAFVGHIEGITHIDSKGDGRYILSNGKDQSMKLWDLRMAMSTHRFENIGLRRNPTFDYRWDRFREPDWFRDPNDNSAVTFRGHDVLRTLIRCHFPLPRDEVLSECRAVLGFVYKAALVSFEEHGRERCKLASKRTCDCDLNMEHPSDA
ncbi:unnamed protein product [Parascedosporium putredinis]|uniref:WD40 repeat-like protein n=1 Tax=Parascedosporium putredinis TaxID=1442378 RepID=A0A9P1MEG1_9PEZI|nr:unnamed protein product [Parascedosporium putredinis]CAI8001451.1 unnamed protein product [Parascedosporium putredinis]